MSVTVCVHALFCDYSDVIVLYHHSYHVADIDLVECVYISVKICCMITRLSRFLIFPLTENIFNIHLHNRFVCNTM